MRIASVIGPVTLSKGHDSLVGSRLLIAIPYSLAALREQRPPDGEDFVLFDQLGAGIGSLVGVAEGAEAAAPFLPERKPVDAFCACILDRVGFQSHE
jgi:ethanolamine utilization protein EutN